MRCGGASLLPNPSRRRHGVESRLHPPLHSPTEQPERPTSGSKEAAPPSRANPNPNLTTCRPAAVPVVGSGASSHPSGRSEGASGGGGGGASAGVGGGAPGPAVLPRTWGGDMQRRGVARPALETRRCSLDTTEMQQGSQPGRVGFTARMHGAPASPLPRWPASRRARGQRAVVRVA